MYQTHFDLHYSLDQKHATSQYYRNVANYLQKSGPADSRAYAGQKGGTVIVHRKYAPLDFAFNASGITVIKLNARKNVIFLEYCNEVEILMDDSEYREFDVYLGDSSSKVKDTFMKGADLFVRYSCSEGNRESTIVFRDFCVGETYPKVINIRSLAKITHINTDENAYTRKYYIGEMCDFYESWSNTSYRFHRSRIFHFINSQSQEFFDFVKLENLRRIFVPDVHYARELKALKSPDGTSLYLVVEGIEKVMAFKDYYAGNRNHRNISLVLRDERITLARLVESAIALTEHEMMQVKQLIDLHIDNTAIALTISADFETFLDEKMDKFFIFFVSISVEDVTIIIRGESLVLDCDGYAITVHNWDSVGSWLRPLFVLKPNVFSAVYNKIILDVTDFKLDKITSMNEALQKLQGQ
jgi:hypothetical protein